MSKILIVEDDPLMSRLYKNIFTLGKNFEVEMATDGEEALTKVAASHPSIILLDVMMPKMNGLQVLEQLKNDPATRDIPVVMLSNLAGDDQAADTALAKGAAKYIVKSAHEPNEIADIVENLMPKNTDAEQQVH
jgi:CheY-like chemotaxis protein